MDHHQERDEFRRIAIVAKIERAERLIRDYRGDIEPEPEEPR